MFECQILYMHYNQHVKGYFMFESVSFHDCWIINVSRIDWFYLQGRLMQASVRRSITVWWVKLCILIAIDACVHTICEVILATLFPIRIKFWSYMLFCAPQLWSIVDNHLSFAWCTYDMPHQLNEQSTWYSYVMLVTLWELWILLWLLLYHTQNASLTCYLVVN